MLRLAVLSPGEGPQLCLVDEVNLPAPLLLMQLLSHSKKDFKILDGSTISQKDFPS